MVIFSRREFVKTSAAAVGAVGLGVGCAEAGSGEPDAGPLSILVLGGTGFIGPHMVEYALSRGHTVTLFNRGRTNTHLFPDVEKLVGDRDGDLGALEGRQWDAVIDNSGYIPRHVTDSAQLLAGSVGRYVFVSSISAYEDLARAGIEESYEVGRLDDPNVEEVTGETYGPLKALCEEAVQAAFGDGATIVRPGYIVGPGDPTDRWTYWPIRAAAGGNMVVPGTEGDPIQFIDARDLTGWMVRMIEQGIGGEFNGVGPVDPMSMADMMETCRNVSGSEVEFHWVDGEFLEEQGVSFPIWNSTTGPFGGGHLVSHARAIEAGYTSRPVAETVAETLEWWSGLGADRTAEVRAGLRAGGDLPAGSAASLETMMEHERRLLQAWNSRAG